MKYILVFLVLLTDEALYIAKNDKKTTGNIA